jgi:hypothetical protein
MPAPKTLRYPAVILAAAFTVALSATASADPTPALHARSAQPTEPTGVIHGDTYTETHDANSQAIIFWDEPVDGGFGGPPGALLVIRPTAARAGLITPRASFVQEMLKSVEQI